MQTPRPSPIPVSLAVRGVLLDAGNTLFFERPSRFEIYASAARDLGLPSDLETVRRAMVEAHVRVPPVEGESARYTDRWFRAYVPTVYRGLGADDAMLEGLTESLLARYRRTASLHLFAETEEVLDALARHGLRLAVVSNWSPRLHRHLERLGLSTRFDAVLVSATEGVEKPQAEIFRRACARLGIEASEAIHVGDHPVNDVEGARSAGVRGILLDRSPDRDGRHAIHPPMETIRSLRELTVLVGAPS